MSDTEWQRVRYDNPADGVGRITLARPEMANAQDYLMLSELNEAFDRAVNDTEVRVIVLAADGKHFSSGHDLRSDVDINDLPTIGTQCHFDAPGAEGYMAREAEMYVNLCWRWRNISKPTIFSPFGLGVLDLAVGQWVYTKAVAAGQDLRLTDFFFDMER